MNTGATSADGARRLRCQHLHLRPDVWPGSFLELAFLRSFELVISPILLDELDEKLRRKFAQSDDDADRVRAKLESAALVIEPNLGLTVVTDDPDDDRVLECAVAGRVGYIVSGDRHLLKLGSYRAISIVTAREFMTGIEAGL
jgi:putative PIN family toxin of toxin-antitoxin system